MKRILFLLDIMPNRLKAEWLRLRMRFQNVTVEYGPADMKNGCFSQGAGTLMVTDNPMLFKRLKEKGFEALVYLHDKDDIDNFPGAVYFVLDAEDTEYRYFDRVYRRIHDIPWEIIRTERLILRETIESDVDEFVKIYSDPSITRYTEKLYEDAEAEKKYVREYRDKVYACQGYGVWTVIRKEDGKIIGRAGLSSRNGYDGVEIGFVIGSAYQQRGYATEAILATLNYAFVEKLGPVNALVLPENKISQKTLEKCGFEHAKDVLLNGEKYEQWRMTPSVTTLANQLPTYIQSVKLHSEEK